MRISRAILSHDRRDEQLRLGQEEKVSRRSQLTKKNLDEQQELGPLFSNQGPFRVRQYESSLSQYARVQWRQQRVAQRGHVGGWRYICDDIGHVRMMMVCSNDYLIS